MNMWQPMLNDAVVWSGRVGTTVAALNGEWLGFVGRRLEEEVGLAQRLGVCKGPDEAWHACSHFLLKAVADYQHEFAELARLGSAAAADSAPDMQGARRKELPGKRSHASLPV
jgi:hypothetical protein